MANYCTNCGAPLGENGICPNCGMAYSTDIPQENQIFIDDNGVYVDAAGNPIPPEQFQPVDLSGYYTAPNPEYSQQGCAPNPEYPQQEYAPNPEYPQQGYAPNPEYPQQGYTPNPEYPQQGYTPNPEYPQQGYAPNPEYPQQGYAPNPEYPQQGYAPNPEYPQRSNVQFTTPLPISEWLDCTRDFFTKEPLVSVEKVMNGRNYSWAIFAGLNAFAAALCTAGITGNGFNTLIEKIFGSYAFMISYITEYSFGVMTLLFFVSLISFAVLFFASSACEYVFLSAVQKKASFSDILKIVSISYFPMAIVCVAAFIFSFFLLPMSAVLLIAGFVASFMLLNDATKKLVGDVPFWGLVLNNIAQVVVAMVIISIALAIAL